MPVLTVTKFGVLVEIQEETVAGMATYFARSGGKKNEFQALPDEVTGYPLDPQNSFWSIVVPEATQNYCENPSFENQNVLTHSFSGWNVNPAISSSYPYASRGVYFVAATPTAGQEANLRYSWTRTEGPWTFSCDVFGHPDEFVTLQIGTASGTFGSQTYKIEQFGWNRFSVTANLSGTGTAFAYLIVPTSNNGYSIFTDGWQIEPKAYATTYCDGDMIGNKDRVTRRSYFWRGAAHASISERLISDSLGGKIVSFSEESGFLTTSIVGMGLPAGDIQEHRVGPMRRTIHDTVYDTPRDFTITGKLINCNYDSLHVARAELEKLLRYDNTVRRDQVLLQYRPVDVAGIPYGKVLQIPVIYSGGMAGNITNYYQENVAIQFRGAEPRLSEIFDNSQELTINETFANNGIIYRDSSGHWQRLGTGTTDNVITGVEFAVHPQNGGSEVPFACGWFTQLCGDSLDYFGYWDGSNWNEIGALNNFVYHIVASRYPDNRIYVMGAFTTSNALPVRRIGYLDSSGTILECGTGVDDVIRDAVVGPDGWLYFVGDFVNDGTTLDHVAQYDPVSDTIYPFVLGNAGVNNDVYSCCITPDNYLWICGVFTADGASNVMYGVARCDLSKPYDERSFEAITTDQQVLDGRFISAAPDGSIYLSAQWLGGDYEVRRWNGTVWEQIWDWDSITIEIPTHFWSPEGVGYLGRYDFEQPDIQQQAYTISNINQLGPVEFLFDEDYDNGPNRMAFGENGEILISNFDEDAGTMSGAVSTTVTNNGTSIAYPAIRITGPATLRALFNRTTGAAIWFKHGEDFDVTVVEGEMLFIDLSYGRLRVYSTLRQGFTNVLYPPQTSVSRFWLQPGENTISVLVEGKTEDTEIHMIWKNNHWDISNAI